MLIYSIVEKCRTVLFEEENDHSMTYYVKHVFENVKPSRDIAVYFSESFRSFETEKFSRPRNDVDLMNIKLRDTDLRGYSVLPRQVETFVIHYKLLVYKDRP